LPFAPCFVVKKQYILDSLFAVELQGLVTLCKLIDRFSTQNPNVLHCGVALKTDRWVFNAKLTLSAKLGSKTPLCVQMKTVQYTEIYWLPKD